MTARRSSLPRSFAGLAVGVTVLTGLLACNGPDVERHTIPTSDQPAAPRRARANDDPSNPPSAKGNDRPSTAAAAGGSDHVDTNNASSSGLAASSDGGGVPGELAWTAPPSWKPAPNPSPMRKATYKIPKAPGDPEDAELSVTLASGAVDSNVTRWSGQFEDAKTVRGERALGGGIKVTIVEIRGTLKGAAMPMAGGAPTEPKKGWALLGAIAETSSGMTFFKMTGPAKTVGAARPDLDALVASLRVR